MTLAGERVPGRVELVVEAALALAGAARRAAGVDLAAAEARLRVPAVAAAVAELVARVRVARARAGRAQVVLERAGRAQVVLERAGRAQVAPGRAPAETNAQRTRGRAISLCRPRARSLRASFLGKLRASIARSKRRRVADAALGSKLRMCGLLGQASRFT
jgi:hypothetical protein